MSKKLEKAYKALDQEMVNEIEALSPEELKQRVVQASQAMESVQKDLDNNSEYQEVLENKKAMEQAKKDINKRQKAIITVALNSLESKGQ